VRQETASFFKKLAVSKKFNLFRAEYKKHQSTISQGAFLINYKNSQVTTILPNLVLKLIK